MATYYLDTAGDNGNDGSSGKPWETLQHAANTLGAGDSLIIRAGTYDVTDTTNFTTKSGTSGNWITYQADAGATVVFKYTGAATTKWQIQGVHYIQFLGITVDGGMGSAGGQCIRVRDATHIKFLNCVIRNTKGCGIRALKGTLSDISVIGCTVHPEYSVEDDSRDGILVDGAGGSAENMTVSGCTVYHVDHVGIQLREVTNGEISENIVYDVGNHRIQVGADSANIVVRDNVLYQSAEGWAGTYGGNGVFMNGGGQQNIQIYGNVAYNLPASGVFMRDAVKGPIYIWNNTFYRNRRSGDDDGELGAYSISTSPAIEFYNNIVSVDGRRAIWIHESVNADFLMNNNCYHSAGAESLRFKDSEFTSFAAYVASAVTDERDSLAQQDPQLTDLAGGGFAIPQGSPCVDAGRVVAVGLPYFGAAPDIGARQYRPPTLAKPELLSPANHTQTDAQTVEFTWTAVEAATRYQLQLDNQVYPTEETSVTRELDPGSHSWAVQALDGGGTASGYTDAWSLMVKPGERPPQPMPLGPVDEAVVNTANVVFAWSDVGVPTYHLQIDGAVHTGADTSMTRTLTDGAHEWAVQAQDEAGQVSEYTALRTLTVKAKVHIKVLKLDLTLVDESGESYGPFTCELALKD